MDEEAGNEATAHMFERMRAPTTDAEFDALIRRSIEREALAMLEAAAGAARQGGGL